MIYANLPVTCRFIPIDINDEVFQIVFMFHFPFYLENAANKYMELVDDPETQNLNEGELIGVARWAKDIYENKVSIEETMNHFKYECYNDKHKKYIVENVKPSRIGFKFGDISQDNVNEAIRLHNEIGDKIFC
jgi:hypothetical protein